MWDELDKQAVYRVESYLENAKKIVAEKFGDVDSRPAMVVAVGQILSSEATAAMNAYRLEMLAGEIPAAVVNLNFPR